MNKKYSALACYFGKWPPYFQLWLTSCKYNPAIDFLLISDIDTHGYVIPDNVIVIEKSFQEVKNCIVSKLRLLSDDLKIESALDRPYKLCDFRPSYGFIFEDLFAGYEYWGWYDLDTIWGNIVSFIPEGQRWLKIYPCGHLSFLLNEEPYKNAFLMGDLEWKTVFSSPKSFYFDEQGGVSPLFKRMELVDGYYRKVDFDNVCPPKNRFSSFSSINYPEKSFCLCYSYERGHLFRNYVKFFIPRKEEISYVHISKRRMIVKVNPLSDAFIIYPNCFAQEQKLPLTSLLMKGMIHPFLSK